MEKLDFDERLSLILDEATIGAEEGDADWKAIKQLIEWMIFDGHL